ncbi:MAG: GyrI-like domain-containing protein [Candidatus Limnocylindria bacterium]
MVVTEPHVAAFERPSDYRSETNAEADEIRLLRIPARRYLMIDGTDEPGAPGFRDAIATLYPVAYTLHFALKRRGVVAPVGALEGLYWINEPGPIPAASFAATPEAREHWAWRLMLPVPEQCTDADVTSAVDEVYTKKRPPLLEHLRCEQWEEGRVAQVLHIGPYEAEGHTVEHLQRAIADVGLKPRGCHHEIYVSDPNRTAPERLKTLIRQPVA